jgi:hypothetical protein
MSSAVFQNIVGTNALSEEQWRFVLGFGLILVIVSAIVLVIVLAPIGAILLRAAARWVASIDVGFGTACITQLISNLIAVPILFGGMCLIPFPDMLRLICCFFLAFVVQAPVIRWRLSVPMGKALLVSLLMFAISIGIVAISYLALFVLFN